MSEAMPVIYYQVFISYTEVQSAEYTHTNNTERNTSKKAKSKKITLHYIWQT